jgi:hypothetical protein
VSFFEWLCKSLLLQMGASSRAHEQMLTSALGDECLSSSSARMSSSFEWFDEPTSAVAVAAAANSSSSSVSKLIDDQQLDQLQANNNCAQQVQTQPIKIAHNSNKTASTCDDRLLIIKKNKSDESISSSLTNDSALHDSISNADDAEHDEKQRVCYYSSSLSGYCSDCSEIICEQAYIRSEVDVMHEEFESGGTYEVLLVSHGSFLREMFKYFANELGCEYPFDSSKLDTVVTNASVSKFAIELNESARDHLLNRSGDVSVDQGLSKHLKIRLNSFNEKVQLS